MVDTVTTNYNLVKPEIGGSNDTWGDKTNENWDKVDAQMKINADAAEKRVRFDDAQTLTPAEKGQALANIGVDNLAGFCSDIINGDFYYWQRPQKTGGAVASAYYCDRWYARNVSTCIIESFANGTRGIRITRASTTDHVYIEQGIENITTIKEGKCTVTFDAMAAVAGRQLQVQLFQFFGISSPSGTTSIPAQTVTLTTTLTRYRLVFDIPSVVGKTFTNSNGLYLRFGKPTGSTDSQDFVISRVSRVFGDVSKMVDPFPLIPTGISFSLCQRYFQLVDLQHASWSSGVNFEIQYCVMLPVQMRNSGSIAVVTAGTFSSIVQSIDFSTNGRRGLTVIGATNSGSLGVYNRVQSIDSEMPPL